MADADQLIFRFMKIAAVVCLIAVLVTSGVQAMHVHAGSRTLDTHCSLCMVSHCVSRPQTTFTMPPPVHVIRQAAATFTSANPSSAIFYWFVRPPPSA